MLPPSMVQRDWRSVARQGAELTRLADRLVAESRTVTQAAFPEVGLKCFRRHAWFGYHGLIRARGGVNNPLGRLFVWALGLRVSGAGPEQFQRLIDSLQELHDSLYSQADLPDQLALECREQEIDAAEDVAQTRYLAALAAGRDGREEAAALRDCTRTRRAHDAIRIRALPAAVHA